MLKSIHKKLGTAGFIISVVALVAALGGGAYAASSGLTGKQKKEVEKIAKNVAKPGKAGANGAAGPAGVAGAKGDSGSAGTNGTPGTPGVSVTGSPITVGSVECASRAGGVKYTLSGTATKVCNGANGTIGFTETLPPGKTETGIFAATAANAGEGVIYVPISFSIPLSEPGTEAKLVKVGVPDAECTGTYEQPTAPAGFLCAYAHEEELTNAISIGVGAEGIPMQTTGSLVLYDATEAGATVRAYGSWAVTAPTP